MEIFLKSREYYFNILYMIFFILSFGNLVISSLYKKKTLI